MMKRFLALIFVTMASAAVFAQQKPPATEQYLPVDQLPPTEQMPSAPYVIAAYGLIWLIAMFYLWTIWRRIGKLETDMHALERQRAKGGAGR